MCVCVCLCAHEKEAIIYSMFFFFFKYSFVSVNTDLYTYTHRYMCTKGAWVMVAPRICSLGSFVEFKDHLFFSNKLSLFLFVILAFSLHFIGLKSLCDQN